MKADLDTLHALLREIETLIAQNEAPDGRCRFDLLRAVVALDFAKTEIEKTIHTEIP